MTADESASGNRRLSDKPGRLAVFRPQTVALIGFAFLLPLACAIAFFISDSIARKELAADAQSRLVLHDAKLNADLRRHAAIPRVLASDWQVVNLLTRPASPGPDRPGPQHPDTDAANRRLEDIARALRALAVYIMDANGKTVASSNWQEVNSFVGRNFSYRSYFTDAMTRGEGRQFALGTSSMMPGYYTSHRVEAGGQALGVVVLKVGFDALEIGWRTASERILVTDREGMVFITNTAPWRYHRLPQFLLPEQSSATAAGASDPFSEQPSALRILPWRQVDTSSVRLTDSKPGRLNLLNSASLPDSDWSIHMLTDFEPVRVQNWMATTLTGGLVILATLIAMSFAQRRMALADRLRLHRTAQSRLERRIAEVTSELREAENELTQAAKLAALGQMSAGIAHEINQPLTAIRGYADNAVVLLQRGRPEIAADNLREISALTDRMAEISRQLKGFARRASPLLVPVDPAHSITQSLSLLRGRLRRDGIEPVLNLPDHVPAVLAEDIRLQQVLVNLITNAADAVRDRDQPLVMITLESAPAVEGPTPAGQPDAALPANLRIVVVDNGPGVAPAVLASLFSPFITTKEPGLGLGLGLSISHGIVSDFGGTLTGANLPAGGAAFTITLKTAPSGPAET